MVHLLLAIIYISFISLGLPDALLGAAWPQMYLDLNTSVSNAGAIFMIISVGTVISSLLSDRLTRVWGTGKLTTISVAMTAIALFGFSISDSFVMVCLRALPYGLGAGSVDASLNNYVALHYAAHHMSWLHCMWGIGATVGPYVMGIMAMLLPFSNTAALAGLILVGLGCAPIYPCVIHSTPINFGEDRSQAIVGVQMASAYVGNIIMPPLFGIIAENIAIKLLPVYLLLILLLMFFMHGKMLIKCEK